MKIIAHRGALDEALENSFDAFDRAIAIGADRIELDIRATKDGELAVMHDDNLQRTARSDKSVGDSSRRDLESVKLINGEPIPFLDQVVERYSNQIELNIEIKTCDVNLAKSALRMVKEIGIEEQVIFSSFHWRPLAAIKAEGFVQVACLVAHHFDSIFTGNLDPINFMRRVQANIIHPNTRMVNQNFMDQAKSRRWQVFPYCELENGEEHVDREGLWTALAGLGVDGLCTNYPRDFYNWVQRSYGFKAVHKEAQQ